MANRRVIPEVQKIFDKYVDNKLHVRRLERTQALDMLQEEFDLDIKASQDVMDYFDADKNGCLSLWEFQHFYTLAGSGVAKTASLFDSIDISKKRYLSKEETETALEDMTSVDGKPLDEKDIVMIMKSAKDENKINLGDFIAIMYRIKLYRKPRG